MPNKKSFPLNPLKSDNVTPELLNNVLTEIFEIGFDNARLKNTISRKEKRYFAVPSFTQYEEYLIEISSKYDNMTVKEYLKKAIINECKRTITKMKIVK